MWRTPAAALLAALCGAIALAAPAGAKDPPLTWGQVASGFSWAPLRPSDTLGLHRTAFALMPEQCDDNEDFQGYQAEYGKIPARWFNVYVAKGELCGDGSEASTVGHVLVHGARAQLAVWQSKEPRRPTLADGYRDGMSLEWKEHGIAISIEAFHLRLPELLRLARGLRPIPRS